MLEGFLLKMSSAEQDRDRTLVLWPPRLLQPGEGESNCLCSAVKDAKEANEAKEAKEAEEAKES